MKRDKDEARADAVAELLFMAEQGKLDAHSVRWLSRVSGLDCEGICKAEGITYKMLCEKGK